MIQIKRSELKQLAQNKLGDDSIESQNKVLVMISTSLAARTSYTIVGEEKEINYENLIALHDNLLTQEPPHSSPFEHCARAMSEQEYTKYGIWTPFVENDKIVGGELDEGWCGNFRGFIQYRKMFNNENITV